jgi:hypothetical protein
LDQTSDVMEVKGSPMKLIGLFAVGVLLTGTSAALAFRWIPSRNSVVVGWFGLLFFGLCTTILLWRLLTAGRTVVTITSQGIKDARLSGDVVPWRGIQSLSTAQIKRQRFIVLAIDPSIEQQLTLKPIARLSRGPNRMLGINGLCISAAGLQINHDALFKACLAHWQTAQG